jgi:hypothetical protein
MYKPTAQVLETSIATVVGLYSEASGNLGISPKPYGNLLANPVKLAPTQQRKD